MYTQNMNTTFSHCVAIDTIKESNTKNKVYVVCVNMNMHEALLNQDMYIHHFQIGSKTPNIPIRKLNFYMYQFQRKQRLKNG
jgi:hypothetical protein